MHGAGNDFVVLDGFTQALSLDPTRIRALADRHLGIGCDQVLVLEPPAEAGADARYRIFNADGREVEQCGNGARCAADYLVRAGRLPGNSARLQTMAGLLTVDRAGPGQYRVNMGVPDFDPDRIPLRRPRRAVVYRVDVAGSELEFAALAVSNPHAVIAVADVDAAPVEAIGAALQGVPDFPAGVNAGFMQVCAPDRIRLRVFERGVGETLACGSGACAAVAVGRLNHGLAQSVRVELKGGTLLIQWQGEGEPLWMTGPVAWIFEGTTDL
jgi:diaminopimelate epimerase